MGEPPCPFAGCRASAPATEDSPLQAQLPVSELPCLSSGLLLPLRCLPWFCGRVSRQVGEPAVLQHSGAKGSFEMVTALGQTLRSDARE